MRRAVIIRTMIGCAFVATLAAGIARAGELGRLQCTGVLPAWQMEFDAKSGTLTTREAIEMPVMNITRAEGRDWPKALTFVGDRDTAIAIVTPQACMLNETAFDHHILVLTQQDNQPILLTGCCVSVAPE